MDDTITAISTALGVGGISIIRVSGTDAIKIVNSIFKGEDLTKVKTHTIHYGHIVYKKNIIDEVLISVMLAPKTYTKEDVVEINLHGGIATTNKTLEILLNSGCRLAEPGEFTKRAFLNGRIDLVEAEAVQDIINAESDNARCLSVNQLTGKLSKIIRSMKESLLSLEASIEVNIDYPEYEDLEDMTISKVLEELVNINGTLNKLIEESQNGKIIKTGINIAIVGRPNVGKSSILNSLIEEEKAIVTDIAGTTRDIVEGRIILNGNSVNFIDTAGIRKTDNIVEQIGVNKSLKQLETSDIILLVLSYSETLTEEEKELLNKIKNKKHIVFINKNDSKRRLKEDIDGAIYGNTIDEAGLNSLKERIISMFNLETFKKSDFTYISNARQLSLIEKVKNSIESAINGLKLNIPVDVIVSDIARARINLSEILGEVYDEELIDELFSKFCLGK